MERLILEYVSGDGYTYSATKTIPILHNSKEEAIEELSNLILNYQINFEKKSIEAEKISSKIHDIYHKMNQLSNQLEKKGKTKDEKAGEKLKVEFITEHEKLNNLRKELAKDDIVFGGSTIHLEEFFYITLEDKKEIDMPNIFTLDEYYAHLEKPTKSSKNTP